LSFTGHETLTRKLDEGDYNIAELEDKIVIERKSPQDFYSSVIQDHARFKREILRAKDKKKIFYIFIEGHIEDILKYCDSRNFKRETMNKIIATMVKRYDLSIIECRNRISMSKQILQTIENELKRR